MNYIAYGTRKYYEVECEKARFIESAVKNAVQSALDCAIKGSGLDAEDLRLCADVMEEMELKVETAMKALENAIKKESEGVEEQTED